MKQRAIFSIFLILTQISAAQLGWKSFETEKLPWGNTFVTWERPSNPKKTLYVSQNHQNASDENDGSKDKPFKTINKAASVLQPGETVMIESGIYREEIFPVNGGTGADKMCVYQSSPNANVVIKGSIVLKTENWKKGEGWRYSKNQNKQKTRNTIWQYDFDGKVFEGYNPFGMLNLMHDREWLQYQKVNMNPHFKRRGTIFLNGVALQQVLLANELNDKDSGAFWVEHNGLRIHVKFPQNTEPKDYLIEATKSEQIFVPKVYGLGYIAIKGIKFEQCGNGFPVPQRGMISTNRGHHWIIEDCTISNANSVGVDMGSEMWGTVKQKEKGHHVFRQNTVTNCGIAGLLGMGANNYLIEDNSFDNIGWQNAEQAWESGAIKLHNAEHTLIRRNVFTNISFAPGIWLDYLSTKNVRVTKNLFWDIKTARGGIYVEVGHDQCSIDHNVFINFKCQWWINGDYGAGGSAFYTDGSDSINFTNNLIINAENTGFGSYNNAERMIGMRGGISRNQQVKNNVFVDCQKHCIEMPNIYNFTDGNVFANPNPAYIKIAAPQPIMLLDMKTVQTLFAWEKNGSVKKGIQFVQNISDLSIEPLQDDLDIETKSPIVLKKNTKTMLNPRKSK